MINIVRLWGRGKDPTPVIPATFEVRIGEDDEEMALVAELSISIGPRDDEIEEEDTSTIKGQSFGIEYKNAKGEKSQRWVTATKFKGEPPNQIYAFCHARDAFRSFRIDRISAIYDVDGEYTTDVIGWLNDYGLSDFEEEKKSILECGHNGIIALVALSQSDGIMRDGEIDQIVGYAEDVSACEGIYANEDERAFCFTTIRRMRPRSDTVRTAVRKLARESADRKEDFLYRARKLMEVDGKIHENEFQTMLEFKELLNI